MPHDGNVDAIDARILLELAEHPRATTLALADRVGISRNTAQSRLARLERHGALESFEHRISPAALGYPLTAFITAQVTQRLLDEVAAALADVPEVLQVQGISGPVDLMIEVVAADADDLYRIAGRILAIPGVERTNTALVMRQLVDYRITPLLRRTLQ
ncbi:Lrp/AsnC family transcriptional regulator [Prauserella flavalba]|uniref:Lrp/AsnC family transcriptional regulator n=1 Tax=Prauserella flavalba TaxID=1477506 RepID=UPI0036EBD523